MSADCYDPITLKKLHGEILSILDDFLFVCRKYNLEYFGIAGTAIGAIRHKGFIPWDDDIDLAMPRKDFERMLTAMEREFGDRYYALNAKNYPGYPLMTTRLCRRGTVFREEVMKDVDCPFGIFLDFYVLDPIADGRFARAKQAWTAWFFSKLLVLRSVPKPTIMMSEGPKKQVIYAICRAVYLGMKAANISPQYLRKRCEAECRRYEGKKTRLIGFLPDTDPFWDTINTEKCYPVRELPFEGRMLRFPANIDEMLRYMYGDYMVLPPEEKRKTHTPAELVFSDGSGIKE